MPAPNLLFHLAQVNIALMRGGWEDPVMAPFVAQLDEVNALAEASAGFVWRLQVQDDAAIAGRVFGDPMVLFNLSLWESLESLRSFVYAGRHLDVMRGREQWFRSMQGPHVALWWVRAGSLPSVEEGKSRLDLLGRIGPTDAAFTFSRPFPAPGAGSGRAAPGVC